MLENEGYARLYCVLMDESRDDFRKSDGWLTNLKQCISEARKEEVLSFLPSKITEDKTYILELYNAVNSVRRMDYHDACNALDDAIFFGGDRTTVSIIRDVVFKEIERIDSNVAPQQSDEM